MTMVFIGRKGSGFWLPNLSYNETETTYLDYGAGLKQLVERCDHILPDLVFLEFEGMTEGGEEWQIMATLQAHHNVCLLTYRAEQELIRRKLLEQNLSCAIMDRDTYKHNRDRRTKIAETSM